MRKASRHGDGTNINQRLNGMGLKRFEKFVEGPRGVADGVERRHVEVSMERRASARQDGRGRPSLHCYFTECSATDLDLSRCRLAFCARNRSQS